MVIRTLLVACACVGAVVARQARAGDPEGGPAGVPIVLGDDGSGVEASPALSAGATDDRGEVPGPWELVGDVAEDVPVAGHDSPPAVAACTGACAGQGWRAYATFDVLAMERANTAGPLAVQGPLAAAPGTVVLTADDVRYPTFGGGRLFQGWRRDECGGAEIGYLGVWGMHADALAASADGSLALPGELGLVPGSGLEAASVIRPSTNAVLNSVECNLFTSRVHAAWGRSDPLPWRRTWAVLRDTRLTADWLLGIRWAGLDETATLDVTALTGTSPPAFSTTGYRVTSSSQLVGPQIGHRRRIEWHNWAVEGWAKATLAASFLSQAQGPVVGPFDLVEIRGPRSGSRAGVGMIGDLNLAVTRRLGDHWGLRAGYTLVWLSDVAPAANQWDFTDSSSSGTAVALDTVFLHGATLGVEASW